MGVYSWGSGTIELPTKDVAPLRKVLRETSNALREAGLARAKETHKELSPRSSNCEKDRDRLHLLYSQRLANRRALAQRSGSYLRPSMSGRPPTLTAVADALSIQVLLEQHSPRVPTAADVDRVLPKLTNRDSTFVVVSDDGRPVGSIVFTGRSVQWEVPDEKNASGDARYSLLGRVFFDYLARVKWTRGTGGCIVGNDELNQEDDLPGGGGNYVVEEYGPVRKKAAGSRG